MAILKTANLAEQIQDYIAANSGLSLTVGTNFTLGNVLDLVDIGDYLTSKIDLTMFDEGGSIIPHARRYRQERSFRFVYKGDYGQEAVNSCWSLLTWLINAKTFITTDYRLWVVRTDSLPSIIAANKSGTHVASFVVSIHAYNLTG